MPPDHRQGAVEKGPNGCSTWLVTKECELAESKSRLKLHNLDEPFKSLIFLQKNNLGNIIIRQFEMLKELLGAPCFDWSFLLNLVLFILAINLRRRGLFQYVVSCHVFIDDIWDGFPNIV